MKQIRNGVFETNSSSVHAICISKTSDNYYVPDEIHFGFNDFGWQFDTYDTVSDKASYLWTAICSLYVDLESVELIKDKIEDWIKSSYPDINITFSMPTKDEKWNLLEFDGYIDHYGETRDFVDYVLENANNLFDYLFSDDSFVATGNDNSDDDIIPYNDINEDNYTIFWKGN